MSDVKEKRGTLPKYEEVARGILREINEGRFKVGDRIWSESEMIRRFNVSASTVQKAVSKLVYQDILYREQGRGTFLGRDISTTAVKRLALILPSGSSISHDSFLGPVVDGINARISLGEYRIILASDEASLTRISAEDKLDGVMIAVMSEQQSSDLVHRFFSSIPVVFVSSHPRSEDFPYVIIDNEDGAYQATQHLIGLGHRSIAFVTGGADKSYKAERYAGYVRAMTGAGIEPDQGLLIQVEDWAESGGRAAADRCAEIRPMPTAVLAVSDGMAFGLMQRFRELRIRVPLDVAIVGFNNLPMCEYVEPSLTTVDGNLYEMGCQAIALLERIVYGEESDALQRVVPADLIVRESSGAHLPNVRT